MQILYGIAQSIEREKKQYKSFSYRNNTPVMYSTCHNEAKLNNLFLVFYFFFVTTNHKEKGIKGYF
mgnify:CR=1 FL=1